MPQESSARLRGSSLLFGTIYHESETLIYVLLSAVDLLVTYFLLSQQSDNLQFVEANPFARFFLDRWGIKGMIYFKFAMVALVCVVAQVIARWKPMTARLVLWFAIVVMIYVVVYSVKLYRANSPDGGLPWDDLSARWRSASLTAAIELDTREDFAQTGITVPGDIPGMAIDPESRRGN